ncbi:MAG: hypothetical protein WB810_07645 [Candidatus Cybelea sp.]
MALDFGRMALCSCAAAATLAACGGSQPPIGAPGAMQQTPAIATHADRSGSWMLPEAKSETLVYVTTLGDPGDMYVYDYASGNLVGRISKLSYPSGACSDVQGNVFIAMQNASEVYEYAHGGTTPIAILSTEGYQPQSCSVDPNTGNLAVCGDKGFNEPGAAAVFQNEQGSPTIYPTDDTLFFCAYDNHSNLFADVGNLLELPNGSSTFKSIFINGNSGWYHGSIQWDGGAFAINVPTGNPRGPAVVYRVSVSGSQGSIIGKTLLYSNRGSHDDQVDCQFWNYRSRILASQKPEWGLAAWRYPSGGKPRLVFRPQIDACGITVSIPPPSSR